MSSILFGVIVQPMPKNVFRYVNP